MQGKLIPITEIYGPVIQGEGPVVGMSTHFIRSFGCDYGCSWCDSMFSVKPELRRVNSKDMTSDEIVEQVLKLSPAKLVTFSGGNPLIYDFKSVAQQLRLRYTLAVETQGTIWRPWIEYCTYVVVSPKPPSSKQVTDYNKLDVFVQNIGTQRINGVEILSFKIVVFDEEDFEYAKHIARLYPEISLYLQVGTDTSLKNPTVQIMAGYRWLSEKVLQDSVLYEARVLPQLHTIAYGQERGK